MQTEVTALLRCPACGAEFDAASQTCPYCGHVNEAADERGFYRDLRASEQAVKDMVDIPEETATKEARRAGKLIAVVLAVFAVLAAAGVLLSRVFGLHYDRDEEADYLWMQENLPKFQAAYDEGMSSGDFDALLSLYEAERNANQPVWRFAHDAFTGKLYAAERSLADEIAAADRLAETGGARYRTHLQLLFYDEMELALIPESRSLSEEEKAILLPLAAPYVADMTARFSMSDGEFAAFREDYLSNGYLSYTDCEKFVDGKMK